MFHLVTELEVRQLRDTLEELAALADPSEYSREEVKGLISLLKSLKPLDTEIVLELNRLHEELKQTQQESE